MSGGYQTIQQYDPKSVDIKELAKLILNLDSKQQEELELILDREAMGILKKSEEDIKMGRTVPIEQW